MSYRIWLTLFFVGFNAVCSAKDFEPFAGSKPIAVLLLENPAATVMGAETPRIAIYENGDVIFSRGDPAQKQPTYFYAEIGMSGLADVIGHLKSVTELKKLKSLYSLTDASDRGAALFYLRTGDKAVVTSVYGLRPGAGGSTDLPAGRIPDQLRELYHYLMTVEFTESRPWHPTYVEAMLWPDDVDADKLIHWPKDWPDLHSNRAVPRKTGYSIFLDGSMRDDLQDFLAGVKAKDAVSIDGMNWTAASRPVFPSEPVWRKAFSNIEDN